MAVAVACTCSRTIPGVPLLPPPRCFLAAAGGPPPAPAECPERGGRAQGMCAQTSKRRAATMSPSASSRRRQQARRRRQGQLGGAHPAARESMPPHGHGGQGEAVWTAAEGHGHPVAGLHAAAPQGCDEPAQGATGAAHRRRGSPIGNRFGAKEPGLQGNMPPPRRRRGWSVWGLEAP